MNILFANYGDFTTNSLNHIAGFAHGLIDAGHDCVVAVPDGRDSLTAIPNPRFTAATFADVLANPALFKDGKAADIVHAWTPREGVRRFVLAHQRLVPARLVVHLEDNEEFLVSSYMGESTAVLREKLEEEFPKILPAGLPHPVRFRNLLRLADGVTVIVDELRALAPADVPFLSLPPGVDFTLYRPLPADPDLRKELGIRAKEKVLVYTGSTTFANESEIRDLYLAVKELNQRGYPTRLIRTGFNSPSLLQSLPADWESWTIDLGFIHKERLPGLLGLADVLVQPGAPGEFNDLRLPSKLPEFLASGRPVVLPAANLGLQVRDGEEALVLPVATPTAIADACVRLFEDPSLARRLGAGGAAFAHRHFDLRTNAHELAAFYVQVSSHPATTDWRSFAGSPAEDTTLLAHQLLTRLSPLAKTGQPAWQEVLAQTDDLIRLCRQLETVASGNQTPLQALRVQLERERDDWKRTWELTDGHARHLAGEVEETKAHAANVEKNLAEVSDHAANLEQNLTAARDHSANLERSIKAVRDHAANLEQNLTAARAHGSNLEKILGEVRTHAANLEQMLGDVRGQLAQVESQRDQVTAQRDLIESQRDTAELQLTITRQQKAELEQQLDQTRSRLDQSEDRVRRMVSSFSWKSTAWLRSLRRLLIDPSRHKAAASPIVLPPPPPEPAAFGHVAPAASPEAPSFQFTVDYPHTWSFGPKKILVRGWCFALNADAFPIKSIRARIDGRIHAGVYGLKRLDVLAAMRAHPQAEYCGFKVEVDLLIGDAQLSLEVDRGDGQFVSFFAQGISVREGGGVDELTDYQKWIEVFERPTVEQRAAITAEVAAFTTRPVISVIVPVYNTPEIWLVKAVNSVRAQSYPHWELCLADDKSPSPHVRPLLEKLAASDPRIKVVFRPANGHISAASNSALEIATGQFIALLDHDDELAVDAFYEVARVINAHPETDVIYSDEDKIDEEGKRYEPYFKPDWLPDLFVGQNYLSHLTVYRATAVRTAGGFRLGYEGSQDWDLALRVTDAVSADRIRHIPKVLYHWRAIPGSTALNISEKNYPLEAARRALNDHFARRGESVVLQTVPGDHWRIRRPLGAKPPLVSLVIPTRNGLKFLQRCVDSMLAKTRYPEFEIVVVDNGSDDPATLAYLQQLERGTHPSLRPGRSTRVLRYQAPFNYSAINNFAVGHARGEIVGLMNNDLEVIHDDWLDEMVSQALRPEIGCVGALLYYPNDTIQHAGVLIGMGGVAGHAFRDFPRGTEGRFNRARLAQNYTAVTAACLVVRKAVYQQVGGLDEKSLAVAFNDIDFCLKVYAAGYRNLWTPFAELYHHESATRGAEDTPEKHERFRGEVETMLARWADLIRHDPAYNPNLSLELTDFTLSAPPRPWKP